jgi:hypothetical protein
VSLRAFVFCGVAGLLAAVWSPLAPTRLFDFDAANFALSLEYFQPTGHQPQPPGYPLYVGLIRVIHLLVDDVPLTFLIAGLIGATAAILMLWILGERMFGRQAGVYAALLFMTNPILWQTGMSDQVRIYIAVISIGVALAAWPLFERSGGTRRFAAASLLLGVLAGFRPEMLVSMAPLLVIAAVRNRMKFRDYLAAGLAFAMGMAPWLTVLLWTVGGIGGFMTMMRIYSADQASGSSVLFGAGWSAAGKMVASAFWWASLGLVSWMPAVLMVRWRKVREEQEGAGWWFLLVWFLSLFLFSIAVHIAASGHALGFIPVLCLAGGWVLSAVGRTRGRLVMVPCVILALALNVTFFFKPYAKEVREASYHTIAGISAINENTLEKIDLIMQRNSAFLVTDNNAWVSWRILEYYYPETPLLYLPGPWANPAKPPPAWLFQNRVRVQDVDPNAELNLPSCATIVWLVSDSRSKRAVLTAGDAEDERYFIATPAQSGVHYQVGRYRLATSPEPCHAAQ